MGVGGLASGLDGAFCVSKEVTGKFSLCNFCISSVGDRGVCHAVLYVLSSAAFL